MPDRSGGARLGQKGPERTLRASSDREAIIRMADDLLPALIAKLSASGLGEIEVREGDLRARLRKPAQARQSVVKAAEGHPAVPTARNLSIQGRLDEIDRHLGSEDEATDEPDLVVAKSPAVGVYHPRRDLVVGMRIRSGDRIGSVDVLGVHQDVVSPVDGLIGSSLAEAGEGVEYGQELVRIELPEGLDAEAGRLERGPTRAAGKA